MKSIYEWIKSKFLVLVLVANTIILVYAMLHLQINNNNENFNLNFQTQDQRQSQITAIIANNVFSNMEFKTEVYCPSKDNCSGYSYFIDKGQTAFCIKQKYEKMSFGFSVYSVKSCYIITYWNAK